MEHDNQKSVIASKYALEIYYLNKNENQESKVLYDKIMQLILEPLTKSILSYKPQFSIAEMTQMHKEKCKEVLVFIVK